MEDAWLALFDRIVYFMSLGYDQDDSASDHNSGDSNSCSNQDSNSNASLNASSSSSRNKRRASVSKKLSPVHKQKEVKI